MPETTQKVVLVTGASSGIGKACADHLSTRGYRVFGTQRRVPCGAREVQRATGEGRSRRANSRAIAQLVERILRDPSPRLRYSVGMLGQRIVIPAKRLLPQRLFEWVLARVLPLE